MTDFSTDFIRARREIAAAANAEAAQHFDRAVLDTILEVLGGEG